MLGRVSESNTAINLMGDTLYFNEKTNINQHYSFSLIITVFQHCFLIESKVKKQCWCSVMCAMKTDILPVCYTLAALLSSSKCTADFTWQELSRDDDLYHLFNTSLQTASRNPNYTFFSP